MFLRRILLFLKNDSYTIKGPRTRRKLRLGIFFFVFKNSIRDALKGTLRIMLEDIRFEKDFLNLDFPVDIVYDQETYPTALHAFYAAKSKDAYMHAICASRSTGYASRMGHRAVPASGWDEDQYRIMQDILATKFRNPGMSILLNSVPDSFLTACNENHENLWGTCTCRSCNNKGMNLLGLMLLKIKHDIS